MDGGERGGDYYSEKIEILLGGDFNARTRRKGEGVEIIEEDRWIKEEKNRRDVKINRESCYILLRKGNGTCLMEM